MSWRRLLRRGVLALLLIMLVASLIVVIDGLTERYTPSDVAVVLGSQAFPDGTPSPALAARLDRAVHLHQQGQVQHVIVSGGTGVEGVDEAQVMKAYLLAHQVPSASIWVDSDGVNTRATACYSAALMQAQGWRRAILVSQYFHLSRTRLAFQQVGVLSLGTAHADIFQWRDLYSIPREVVGWVSYWWSGAGECLPAPPLKARHYRPHVLTSNYSRSIHARHLIPAQSPYR